LPQPGVGLDVVGRIGLAIGFADIRRAVQPSVRGPQVFFNLGVRPVDIGLGVAAGRLAVAARSRRQGDEPEEEKRERGKGREGRG
jgi:hypothetical protein